MTKGQDSATVCENDTAISAEVVRNYLLDNPDFLIRHPEVLVHAETPRRFEESENTNVVDFQHAMLQRLQTEMSDLQTCTEELLITTQANLENQKGTFDATLALLDAPTLDTLKHTVSEVLPMLLDMDYCCLRLEGPGRSISEMYPDKSPLPNGFIEAVFGRDGGAMLRPKVEAEPIIYGESAPLILSDALVRIEPGNGLRPGLFALGSYKENTFTEDMSVDLLAFLAKILEHCLRQCQTSSA